ncbi:sulfatase [Pseudomonadales bacterium]|nr:sulfatase [Pseudomonadales bacterium]MDB4631403.1 sulfatase [Pseudomonadales bacterium]MDB4806879.1 sulfatase [Pseudomonadales bacterium]
MIKRLLRSSLIISLFWVVSFSSIAASTDVISQSKVKTPNFIIMYIDDLGYADLGPYQNGKLATPSIDKLVNAGQSWTNFYTSASVCSPSRGALLTGNLPVRTGLYGNHLAVLWPGSETGMPAEQETLAEALKQHGYTTGMFGKWHLGDAPAFLPTRHGFDEWLGIPYSNDMDWTVGEITSTNVNADLSVSHKKWEKAGPIYRKQLLAPRVEDWNVPLMRSVVNADQSYTDSIIERPANQALYTQRFTHESVRFINQSVNDDKPFFLFLSHSMVHVPLFRSPQFVGKSALGLYGDVLEEIDWSVGQIMQALEDKQIENNTYLVFTSDNGPWLTFAPDHAGSAGPLRGGKGQTYDGGMRVMTFFKGPGIKPGLVSEMGMDTDLFNTVLKLANIPPKSGAVDSYDLSATLTADAPSPRKFVPFYRNSTLRAFRLGNQKLHFVTNDEFGGPTTVHEPPILIDLVSDIGETTDLAAAQPQDVERLKQRAAEFKASIPIAPAIFDLQKGVQFQ